MLLAIVFFLGSIISSIYLRATLQWWVEALLLMGFAWVTMRAIDRETVCRWIVYAVLPHAVLGIIQFCTQWVAGSKWVGMATQDPLVSGVSVVESMGRRWLRAYGGFPHPNIFGGWLLMGLVSSIEYRVSSNRGQIWKIPVVMVLSISLVLTFSRSAWVAFVILMGSAALLLLKEWRGTRRIDRFRWALPFIAVIVFAMTVIWQWPLVMVRSSSLTRLEAISVNERRVGIENGIEVFRRHPWFGVGPRATGYALVEEGIVSAKTIPIIPHNVFVLMVGEVGLFGCLLLVLVLRRERQWIKDALRNDRERMLVLLPVFVILCLDHYPWSTWSGMGWTMLIFCLIFAKKDILDTSPDRLAMYGQRN
ncbi:O-antigen ligase family protein [Patescibacteria group bacterium]|nr:O-antigen ligase family protein [Patescibacteria group bacterium]MBP9710295.1 O-antigen ligase family protein [Patescibacteria group bacterium]